MSALTFKTHRETDYAAEKLRLKMITEDAHADDHAFLKKMIWAYFLLLIFEGVLRKWFLPGLATPLLIVRDPIALFVVLVSWRRGLFPVTPYLYGMILISVVGIFTTLLFGHGNLWITMFGARILLLHYPMIFAIGRIFTREDVVKMGKATLWIAIPMAILIILQFYSPQSAWVNRGVGGNMEGSGFSGALGYFRPSGTFSFTNGTTLFFGFAAAFILYFQVNSENINRVVLLSATIALLVAIPLSISRSLFFGVAVSAVFTIGALLRNPKYLFRIIPAILGMVVMFMILNRYDFFQKAMEVFTARFVSANETEGGLDGVLLDRYFGGMLGALSQAGSFPFFGFGMGLGTNVGSMLMKGEVLYLISEGEWGRLVGESGALLGMSVIVLRVALSVKIATAAYLKLLRGDFLPWILSSFGLLVISQSQWGQPTALGFSTIIAGLMLASLRTRVSNGENVIS